jgi:hypothetical protein
MADVTSSQLYDGARNCQVKLTNYSDGTGQTAAVVVNASALNPNPGAHMKIRRIHYNIGGMYVRLQWDGTVPQDIAILANGQDILDWSKDYAGGFPNGATNPTGNIILTTEGALAGSNYTIVIDMIKCV